MIPGRQPSLVLELAPLRAPIPRHVATKAWWRFKGFVLTAAPIMVVGSLILGIVYETGAWQAIADAIGPATESVLGLPAIAGIAMAFAFLRKELALQLLLVFAAVELGRQASLGELMTPAQLFVYAVVASLSIPCIATLAALRGELGTRAAVGISMASVALAIAVGAVLGAPAGHHLTARGDQAGSPCSRSQRMPSRGAHNRDGISVAAYASSRTSPRDLERVEQVGVQRHRHTRSPKAIGIGSKEPGACTLDPGVDVQPRALDGFPVRASARRWASRATWSSDRSSEATSRSGESGRRRSSNERSTSPSSDHRYRRRRRAPAQVEVTVNTHHRGGGGHGLEPRQACGDGRGVAPELGGGRRSTGRPRQGQVELAMRIPAPGLQLVMRGLARSEVRGIGRRRGERRMEPRDQCPDVLSHVRRPLDRHAARCRDEVREELRRQLSHVLRAGHEGPEHRHGGHAAVAGHRLRPAGKPRNAGEPRLLGEVGGQLEVRVQAGLDFAGTP